MYKFIDVTEVSEDYVLPSEALKINGEYIENQISGYRTLNVQGREALSPDVLTYTTGVSDGSRMQNKRFPERIIIVTYQLRAESNEAFREAYNKLGGILNVEDAELIFDDEPDKFFVGTPCIIDAVEPGRNAVVGKFEILCADPFKYSVIEYEAESGLDESSILVDYGGTYKAHPILEADFYDETEVAEDGETAGALTGAGDCGFVAFFTENEKIVQLGDPDEADNTEAYAKSQTLINQLFTGQYAWGTTAQNLWSVNNGAVLADAVQMGSVAMGVAAYAVPANPATTSGTILTATSKTGDVPIKYKVTAKASARTENSVKVNFAITGSLLWYGSFFGRGYGLRASVYVGGAWHNVTLKTTRERWTNTSAHTVNLAVTVTGLTSTQSVLSGMKFKVTRTDSNGTSGILAETACSNLAISQYVSDVPETYYLTASNYGTESGKWHGASITRNIGADAAGEVGAANFTLTYKQKMCIGNGANDNNQMGAFQVQLVDAQGANIAGVRIHKNKFGNWASVIYYVNGVKVYGTTIDLSHNNKYFGSAESSVLTSTITKSGHNIAFTIGGVKQWFMDDAITNMKATKVTFMFEQYSTAPALSYNGLYWAKFVKNHCNTMKDIPNKFSANDVLEADCRNGEIYLNGVLTPSLGALGNDWEDFVLTPGLNQIGFGYSSWVDADHAPKMKVRYREVFL